MPARIVIPFGLVAAALVPGLLAEQTWFLAAFIGLMVYVHLFEHGSHGQGTSHSTGKENESEEHEHGQKIDTNAAMSE